MPVPTLKQPASALNQFKLLVGLRPFKTNSHTPAPEARAGAAAAAATAAPAVEAGPPQPWKSVSFLLLLGLFLCSASVSCLPLPLEPALSGLPVFGLAVLSLCLLAETGPP